MNRTFFLTLAVLLLTVGSAYAQTAFYVNLGGGLTTYKLDDLNDEIDSWNLGIDNIKNGYTIHAGLEIRPANSILGLGIAYRSLQSSESSYHDYSGGVTYGATAYSIEVVSKIYLSNSPAYLGLSIGKYVSTGKVSLSITGYGYSSGDIEASCFGFSPMAGIILPIESKISLDLGVGYRIASSDDVAVLGMDLIDYSMDWSGLFARGSIRLQL